MVMERRLRPSEIRARNRPVKGPKLALYSQSQTVHHCGKQLSPMGSSHRSIRGRLLSVMETPLR